MWDVSENACLLTLFQANGTLSLGAGAPEGWLFPAVFVVAFTNVLKLVHCTIMYKKAEDIPIP